MPLNEAPALRIAPSPPNCAGANDVSCHVRSNTWPGSTAASQSVQFGPKLQPNEYDIGVPVRSSPSWSSIDTLTSVHNEKVGSKSRRYNVVRIWNIVLNTAWLFFLGDQTVRRKILRVSGIAEKRGTYQLGNLITMITFSRIRYTSSASISISTSRYF